ncbi:hypothetical protein [Neisseria lactamica]|uniref:Uncharacterized protein n=1 Tax=Neisseria lactamica TaxID=486 RepID=A0AAU8VB67_NEILA|nr:hypothetical protein [Neisseria lactamica]ARB03590.1 hypothetical protein B2G52_00490 [Neisseria lactamica]
MALSKPAYFQHYFETLPLLCLFDAAEGWETAQATYRATQNRDSCCARRHFGGQLAACPPSLLQAPYA